MKVLYHRLAVRDVREVLDYYERKAGKHLADRFYNEFVEAVTKIQSNPKHFPPVAVTAFRRANLASFPYHVLYEERLWGVKVIVVRHHRRSPRYGFRRQ